MPVSLKQLGTRDVDLRGLVTKIIGVWRSPLPVRGMLAVALLVDCSVVTGIPCSWVTELGMCLSQVLLVKYPCLVGQPLV